MIVTSRFVFLHLHKSGGSFVNEALRRHFPEAKEIGYHLPRRLIPANLAALPVLGLVRNPWSYYVSWYSFQRERPTPNALFRVLSNDGQLDFSATIHNMLDLGIDGRLLPVLEAALPADYGSRGLNLPGHALAPIRGTGLGFYSFLYRYLYGGGTGALHLTRMEDLPRGLLDLFTVIGHPVSEALRSYLLVAPPRNPSRHAPYASYYDEALRERVARQDATVIRAHGYSFD